MASIKIHQDIFSFERKRKGFTTRQITSMVVALIICMGMLLMLSYVFGVSYVIGISVSLICAFPALVCGFMPICNLSAEEFITRFLEIRKRGEALTWEGEYLPNPYQANSKAYKKKTKKKGFEYVG